jgi:hypothetical protein
MAKKGIPNPTLNITKEDKAFVEAAKIDNSVIIESTSRKARPRNISVYDSFWNDLETFLIDFPSEGNKSSLIARVVSDYMIKKRSEMKKLSE